MASKLPSSFDTFHTLTTRLDYRILVAYIIGSIHVAGQFGQEVFSGSYDRSNIPDSIFLVYNKKHISKHRHVGR